MIDNTDFSNTDTPQTQLNESIDALLSPLTQTRPWIMLCSIIGFFFAGLSVLMGLFFVIGMSAFLFGSDMQGGTIGTGFSIGIGLVYMIFGLLFAIPPYFLYRYAKSIRAADITKNMSDIAEALRYQKSFWKFVGICMAIYIGFLILMLIFAVIGASIGGLASGLS